MSHCRCYFRLVRWCTSASRYGMMAQFISYPHSHHWTFRMTLASGPFLPLLTVWSIFYFIRYHTVLLLWAMVLLSNLMDKFTLHYFIYFNGYFKASFLSDVFSSCLFLYPQFVILTEMWCITSYVNNKIIMKCMKAM